MTSPRNRALRRYIVRLPCDLTMIVEAPDKKTAQEQGKSDLVRTACELNDEALRLMEGEPCIDNWREDRVGAALDR